MDSLLRLIVFLTTVALILGLGDWYVLRSWRKFVKQRKLSPWLGRIPLILGCIMLPGTFLLFSWRRQEETQSTLSLVLLILVALWYIPKIPIVVGLLVKDLSRFLRWVWHFLPDRLLRRPSKAGPETKLAPSVRARRKFLQSTGWAMAGVPFIMTGHGFLKTVHDFRVRRVDVPIEGLPRSLEGLQIAQISDVHAGSFYSAAPGEEIVRLVQEQRPDLIAVTGDWVNFDPNELRSVYPAFSRLSADLGVYGSLGNHDHYMSQAEHRSLKRSIRESGVDLLVNVNRKLNIDGGVLQLAGIDNIGMNQRYGDLAKATEGLDPAFPTVLLGHDPRFWDMGVRGKSRIDLMLAGHTHGGQIGVHVLGHEFSFAQVVYEQWAGLYTDGHQHLYINRGLGTTALPIRTGINPEITLITLRKASSETV